MSLHGKLNYLTYSKVAKTRHNNGLTKYIKFTI